MNLADELRAEANVIEQKRKAKANEQIEKMLLLQEEAKELAKQYLDEDINNCIKKCKNAAKTGALTVALKNENEPYLCGEPDYHLLNENMVQAALCKNGLKIERRYVKAETIYDGPGSHGEYTYLMAAW